MDAIKHPDIFRITHNGGITATAPTKYKIIQMMKNRFSIISKSLIYNINAMNRCRLDH